MLPSCPVKMPMMRPRIIVIDDDKHCRELLSMILERNGYEVICLSEPLACPLYQDLDAQCSHDDPCGDLLLTDNRMPGMTGLQFIKIQQTRGCKGAVLNKAIISASWTDEEQQQAEQLGCKILRKPYSIDELLAWIEERVAQLSPLRKLTSLEKLG